MFRILLLFLLGFVIESNPSRVELYAIFDPTPYGTVWDVQVSHDDSTLAIVYADPMRIQIIDLADMSIRAETFFDNEPNIFGDPAISLQISHDGKFAHWFSSEGSVFTRHLWNISNGNIKLDPFHSTDSDAVLDFIFSREENKATLSFSDEYGGVKRVEGWSIEPLERLWVQEGVWGFFRDISPDNRYIVVDGVAHTWILDWENMGNVITITQREENNTFPEYFVVFNGGFFYDASHFAYIYVSNPSERKFFENLQSITLYPELTRSETIQIPIRGKVGFEVRHYDQSGRYVGISIWDPSFERAPINVLFDLQEMQIERELSHDGIIHTGIGAYLELDREPYTLIDFINNEEFTVEYDCSSCQTMFSAQGKFLIGWEADRIEIWQIFLD
jgi:hypothetical protein